MKNTTLAPRAQHRGGRVVRGPAPPAPAAHRGIDLRDTGLRRGFTLIELLVVMLVIAILASMVLAGLYAAGETAKISRTRGTVSKINHALLQRWESYRTRRIALTRGSAESAPVFAARRLVALWDLQRMEMPDHYNDFAQASYPNASVEIDETQNALWVAYRQFLQSIPAPKGPVDPDSPGAVADRNANAECLYIMLVVSMNAEDEVKLSPTEVGDTDDDGVPEVLDAWGRPIGWIRWAPGYLPVSTPYSPLTADTDFHIADPTTQPDPFDPLGVGRPGPNNVVTPPGSPTQYGFKLAPLVYSAGPDGEDGICFPLTTERSLGEDRNPYSVYSISQPACSGQRWRGSAYWGLEGGGHGDNITNHRLGSR